MRFLIVKTSSFGDIIHAFPVINYLKRRFPTSEIDWVVEERCAEVVKSHPDISQVFCINSKKWRKAIIRDFHEIMDFRKKLQQKKYDAVFDLQGNIKSGLITLLPRSKYKVGYTLRTAPEFPNALFTNQRFSFPKGQNIREDYLSIVDTFCRKKYFTDELIQEQNQIDLTRPVILNIQENMKLQINLILENPILDRAQKTIMVCPGSAWRNKQMTPEALIALLHKLKEHLTCQFIFVWGNFDEEAFCQRLQSEFAENSLSIPRLTLPALQNLMTKVDLIIAMDSLPLHLAGTTSTATYSIFGASLSSKYKPIGLQHKTYQGTCPYGQSFEKRCPLLRTCSTGACIRHLSGTDIYKVIEII